MKIFFVTYVGVFFVLKHRINKLNCTLNCEIVSIKGPFPLRAWKRAFFVSFIDLRLKRAVKIKASAKKKLYSKCFPLAFTTARSLLEKSLMEARTIFMGIFSHVFINFNFRASILGLGLEQASLSRIDHKK